MGRTQIHRRQKPARGTHVPVWAEWTDEQLLDLRMCDLDLRLEGTFYQQPIEQLYRELDRRQLLFRPHFWISDEWFTPDGVPGIAVPFYLRLGYEIVGDQFEEVTIPHFKMKKAAGF